MSSTPSRQAPEAASGSKKAGVHLPEVIVRTSGEVEPPLTAPNFSQTEPAQGRSSGMKQWGGDLRPGTAQPQGAPLWMQQSKASMRSR